MLISDIHYNSEDGQVATILSIPDNNFTLQEKQNNLTYLKQMNFCL